MPGTMWDIESLRQLDESSASPISAPLLTGVSDDSLVAEAAIADLAKEEKALQQ